MIEAVILSTQDNAKLMDKKFHNFTDNDLQHN